MKNIILTVILCTAFHVNVASAKESETFCKSTSDMSIKLLVELLSGTSSKSLGENIQLTAHNIRTNKEYTYDAREKTARSLLTAYRVAVNMKLTGNMVVGMDPIYSNMCN